ncbi:MAG: winged helix-turn-helix transcriptional regulator, partial [Methanobacteriota archaeon]
FLARVKVGGRTAYFPSGGDRDAKVRVALARNETTARVLSFLSDRPGASVREVARAFGLSTAGAYWHVKRIRESTSPATVRPDDLRRPS